jgi:hypothetical protein
MYRPNLHSSCADQIEVSIIKKLDYPLVAIWPMVAHDSSNPPNHGSKKKMVGMRDFIIKASIFEKTIARDAD